MKPHATEPCQVEEAGQIFDTRETIKSTSFSYGRMVGEVTTFSDSDLVDAVTDIFENHQSAGVLQRNSATIKR